MDSETLLQNKSLMDEALFIFSHITEWIGDKKYIISIKDESGNVISFELSDFGGLVEYYITQCKKHSLFFNRIYEVVNLFVDNNGAASILSKHIENEYFNKNGNIR